MATICSHLAWAFLPVKITLKVDSMKKNIPSKSTSPEYNDLKRYIGDLEKSETRFHNIVADHMDGIAVMDRKRIVRFVNPAFEEIIALNRNKLLGNKFDFSVQEGKTTEMEFHHKSGIQITAEVCTSRTTWDGEPAWLISLKDVTQRKRLQIIDQRLQQEKTLQFLAKNLGIELSHTISEIIEVLNSIPERDAQNKMSSFLARINRSFTYCQILVKQLMFLGNCYHLSWRSINISEFFRELEPRINCLIPGKANLQLDLAAEEASVKADSQQLEHVVLNMLVIILQSLVEDENLLVQTRMARFFDVEKPRETPFDHNASNAVSITVQGGSQHTEAIGFQAFRHGLVINTGDDLAKQVIDQIIRKHAGELEICKDQSRVIGLRIILPLTQVSKGEDGLDPKTEIEITNLFESTTKFGIPPPQYLVTKDAKPQPNWEHS